MITLRRRGRAGTTTESLAYFNANIAFRTLFDTICVVSGFVFVDYALSLGIPRERMGIFPAIVYLACVFQILGLWMVSRFSDRKRFVLFFGLLEPVLLLAAVIAIPFLPSAWRLWPLLGLIFIAAASMHLTRPTTDAWLSTAIPARIRGRVLGRRFQVVGILTIAGMLIMGLVARYIPRDASLGFAGILAFGCLLGVLAVVMFRRVSLPIEAAATRMRWADLATILRHRLFVRFLGAVVLYNIPFWLLTPYHQVYHLTVLHLRETTIALIMMLCYAVNSLLSPFFGRWVDRMGSRRVIYLFSPFYAGFFIFYLLSGPRQPWLVLGAWICFGIGNAAYASANSAALYHALHDVESRQHFFAAYNLALFLMTSIMAAISTATIGLYRSLTLHLGPVTLDQFHLLYLTGLLLFSGCFLGTQLLPGRMKPEKPFEK